MSDSLYSRSLKRLKSDREQIAVCQGLKASRTLVAFGESMLKATDLHTTILKMHVNKQYANHAVLIHCVS